MPGHQKHIIERERRRVVVVTADDLGQAFELLVGGKADAVASDDVLLLGYLAQAGLGTLVSLMLPYSVTFLIGWSMLFVAWMLLGWPVGPGAPTSLPVGGAAS